MSAPHRVMATVARARLRRRRRESSSSAPSRGTSRGRATRSHPPVDVLDKNDLGRPHRHTVQRVGTVIRPTGPVTPARRRSRESHSDSTLPAPRERGHRDRVPNCDCDGTLPATATTAWGSSLLAARGARQRKRVVDPGLDLQHDSSTPQRTSCASPTHRTGVVHFDHPAARRRTTREQCGLGPYGVQPETVHSWTRD
jgi:hypothetical protein